MSKKYLTVGVLAAFVLLVLVQVTSAAANKVKVCHATSSETNEVVLVDVSDNALQAHLDHGDVVLPEGESDCEGGGPDPL